MTCPGMFVVLVICPVAASVEKVNALNSASPLRFFAALAIRWPLPAFYCKMNLTSRQLPVIIASLALCFASAKLLAYFR